MVISKSSIIDWEIIDTLVDWNGIVTDAAIVDSIPKYQIEAFMRLFKMYHFHEIEQLKKEIRTLKKMMNPPIAKSWGK